MDDESLTRLREIAATAGSARDGLSAGTTESHEAEQIYERLRDAAVTLNERHGWTTEEEFSAMFPTIAARREIDSLNAAHSDGADAPAWESSVRDLLSGLWAWSRGVLFLYEQEDHPESRGDTSNP